MNTQEKGYIKELSKKQTSILSEQNEMILKFVQDKYKINPLAISRDRRGNIIIAEREVPIGNSDYDLKIYARLLGTDGNGKVILLPAGEISLVFRLSYIKELKIVDRFKTNGIGSVLLKLAENVAIDCNFDKLTLDSLLNITKLFSFESNSDQTQTSIKNGIPKLDYLDPSHPKYNGYFDKNLYFYFSHGFRADPENNHLSHFVYGAIPLIKHNLKKTDLSFGVRGKTQHFRKNDPVFKISNTHLTYAEETKPLNYSIEDENEFTPIQGQPTEESLENLRDFLEQGTNENIRLLYY